MEIDGATVLLTGASGGLGGAIARDLARRGAKLVLTARRTELIEALAAELDAEAVTADLTDRADLEALAARAAEVDVLIANAGVGGEGPLDDIDPDLIDFSIDVNLRAPVVLSTAFAQAHLRTGRDGHVVLIGSLAGLAATPGTALYNATKFGLRGFALSLRQDLHGTSVGLSLVAPGFVRDVGMFHEGGIDLPPGVRTCSPDQVARAVASAVERDRGEVFVAPLEMRLGSNLSSVAPGLAATVLRLTDAKGRVEGRPGPRA